MEKGFTLLEIIIVITIIGILASVTVVFIKPFELFEKAKYNRARAELQQIGKALEMWGATEGGYSPDVYRDIPPGIEKYLSSSNSLWPQGSFENSVYDCGNWFDKECIEPAASGTIQITLRQVPGRNPDGSNVWAMY